MGVKFQLPTDMPKASRSAPLRYNLPAPMRRLDTRARTEKARRKRAGPVDDWLCAASAAIDQSDAPLGRDEVRCTVHVEVKEPVEEDEFFADPKTYELHVAVAVPCVDASAGTSVTHSSTVLVTFEGFNDGLDSPDWTRRRPNQKVTFRQSSAELVDFLRRVEEWKTDLNPLIKKLEAVKLK
ncbi:hypothetical protein NM688_g8067 [Phlebia brevispora]|uniref:Uncharacterized protein n=1 Tax=Phlebia brevispora TaxID=194682 RepID=A0ACC1RXN0_9APHY|nr:hypothetical protein NM688_g8067 [Phlebia brevispora]